VDHIKVIVKHLTGHTELGLKNEEAGALTYSTTKAMKQICDSVMGVNSKLCERNDKNSWISSNIHSAKRQEIPGNK